MTSILLLTYGTLTREAHVRLRRCLIVSAFSSDVSSNRLTTQSRVPSTGGCEGRIPGRPRQDRFGPDQYSDNTMSDESPRGLSRLPEQGSLWLLDRRLAKQGVVEGIRTERHWAGCPGKR